MKNNLNYYCRVCGLKQQTKPWGEDGKTPTFDICSCCGVEFGYEDAKPLSVKKYREKWLQASADWFSKKEKPKNWSLEEQLKNVPEDFK